MEPNRYAGCICTNDDGLADRVRMLRNYGSRVKYHNESIGRNSRLDEIQAAVFPVIVDDQARFQSYMEEQGVKTQIHYPIPPFAAQCYKGTNAQARESDFPNAAFIATHEVSLPIYSGMPEEDVERVIEAVKGY